jgi:hypothetical protein
MADRTRIVVNVTRHETCIYEFDGTLSEEQALEEIESGIDPDESKIRSEDIDVVAHEHFRELPCKFCREPKRPYQWHQDEPVCEGCWDDRLAATA